MTVLFSVSASVVMSSIGFGGGVVAIVRPIHAPIVRIAINAIETRTSTASSLTLVALRLNKPGSTTKTTKPIATITQTASIARALPSTGQIAI